MAGECCSFRVMLSTSRIKRSNNNNNNNKIHMGDLIQIDHMVIRKNNLNIRLFNAIDPITRITVSKAYSSANSKNAKDFLINKVLKLFPFKVNSIQWRIRKQRLGVGKVT